MDQDITADLNILEEYRNIISKTELFNVGDIVIRRDEKYLPKSGTRFDYGLVLSCNDVKDDYPGKKKYIKIAILDYRQISVILCDARVLTHATSPNVDDESFKMLKEFSDEEPITEIKSGMLLRPRKNSFIKGYFYDEFRMPLMAIGSYKDKYNITKVHLIGQKHNGDIQEINIDMDMLCLY